MLIKDENGLYTANNVSPEQIINEAKKLTRRDIRRGKLINSPDVTRDFLRVNYAEHKYEIFGMILLDNKHRIIKVEEISRGTIDSASVHPREVLSLVIETNAKAVIIFHNHPSGDNVPSISDDRITKKIQYTLSMIDVKMLDHMIVGDDIYSYAEHGEM